MSGLHNETDEVKCYWLIECMAPKFRRVVENLAETCDFQLVSVLSKMNVLFPHLENDLSIRLLLDKIPPLIFQPEPSTVAQMFFEIEELLVELTENAMSDQEKLILLIKKIHPRTYNEMRQDRFFKNKMASFSDLKNALLDKVMEDWTEKSLNVHKKQLLNPLEGQNKPAGQVKQPFSRSAPTPPPVRSGGKGSGKGKGKGRVSNFKESVPPKFSVTLQCTHCGKTGHYVDQCWKKKREEEKDKKKFAPKVQTGTPGRPLENRTPQPSAAHFQRQPPPNVSSVPMSIDPSSKKRKADAISVLSGRAKTYSFPATVFGVPIIAFLDTGATISAISSSCVSNPRWINRSQSVPLMVGNGQTIFSLGTANLKFQLGTRRFDQMAQVVETDAFQALLGTDFMEGNEHFGGFLTRPPRLIIDNEEVPCQDSTELFTLQKLMRFSHESYHLVPKLREQILSSLGLSASSIKIDCFANSVNHQEPLFMCKQNSLWWYNLTKLLPNEQDFLWANPPFSMMDKLVTKLVLEPTRMVVVHPDWQDDYWAPLLKDITVSRLEIGAGQAIYLRDKGNKPLKAPLWNTQISLVDSKKLSVPLDHLNPKLVHWVKARSKDFGFGELQYHVSQLKHKICETPCLEREIPVSNSQGTSEIPTKNSTHVSALEAQNSSPPLVDQDGPFSPLVSNKVGEWLDRVETPLMHDLIFELADLVDLENLDDPQNSVTSFICGL